VGVILGSEGKWKCGEYCGDNVFYVVKNAVYAENVVIFPW
jgi:hypothetical protein